MTNCHTAHPGKDLFGLYGSQKHFDFEVCHNYRMASKPKKQHHGSDRYRVHVKGTSRLRSYRKKFSGS